MIIKKIIIPNTELEISRLGFGTSSLHHIIGLNKRLELLSKVNEYGISHFDTARMYGEGMAERTIGIFLQETGLRNRITIASKLGISANPTYERLPVAMYAKKLLHKYLNQESINHSSDLSQSNMEISLSKTLRALKTDWLDILFIHEPSIDQMPALEKLTHWLNEQKQVGRVKYIGLAGSASACLAISKRLNGVFDILQVEDSIKDKEADILIKNSMPLQITYGYLRQESNPRCIMNTFEKALQRNKDNAILVSSRKSDHILALSKVANKDK